MKGTKQKYSGYAFTIFETFDGILSQFTRLCDHPQLLYLVIGYEKCPKTGRGHGQGFIVFNKEKSFYSVKRLLKPNHVEPAKQDYKTNIEYCKKSGLFLQKNQGLLIPSTPEPNFWFDHLTT